MTVCLNPFCLTSRLTPSFSCAFHTPIGVHRSNFTIYNFSRCQREWNCVIERAEALRSAADRTVLM